MARVLMLLILLAVIFYPIYYIFLKSPPPLPELDLEEWWGPPHLKEKYDKSIKPFKVEFHNSTIRDLQSRLKFRQSFTPSLQDVNFEYGFNTNVLSSWIKYWADEYPFAEREKYLNQFPQFQTNIQGLNIHFIRVIPEVPAGVKVVPLLLLHGWPGSVREFYEAIPLLTAVSPNRDFALELIIPSLPGYGFSDAAVRPGLGAAQLAVIFKNLMQRLGFQHYYLQGGDWGAVIGTYMSTLFPKDVLGYHTNMAFYMTPLATMFEVLGSFYPTAMVEPELVDRLYPLSEVFGRLLEESGYMHIQATKPDTIGVALSDSPIGLLVYIFEKFSTWTRFDNKLKSDGGLTYRFTKEQLIDNLMIYYTTNSITTSMRLYAETFNKKHSELKLDEIPTPVPTWVVQAKYELAYQPPFILKFKYPQLLNVTALDDGGHFLAFELPKVFSDSVLQAISAFRKLKTVRTEL